jgi:predicted ATPase/DNA-binding CsgD family transcriptional regulator
MSHDRASRPDPVPLRPIAPAPAPDGAPHHAERGSLPRPLTALIGREQERAMIGALLRDGVRLLTLIGSGGVGKTRLAVAVASDVAGDYRDGAVFVPLAGVPEAALVLPALAAALGVREMIERPLLEALTGAMRGRRLLVVLDNLEHVLGAAPEIARLLAACPDLTILATSRAPLRIHGEQRFQTPPLSLPPREALDDATRMSDFGAVALFVQRAREVRHDFALTTETALPIAEICRRVDGLPLAIELAAAWVRVLSLPALAAGLEQRLALLRGGPEDQPARLRTMREAIGWSYDLLAADEARLFRRLAIFAGGFTLEAAEDVGGDGRDSPSTLDLLARLIDTSLVQPMPEDGGEPRFQLLETVREFALEQLAASGEAPAVAAAHAAAMRAFAEQVEPMLLGPEEIRWHARCDAELGNLRASLSWAVVHDGETALRILGPLWVYWAWYQLAEGRRWFARVRAGTETLPDVARSRALSTHAALTALEGDTVATIEMAQAARALARDAGDPAAEALAQWIAGCGFLYAENVADAIPSLDTALRLFPRATIPTDRAWGAYARSHRGAVAMVLGETDLGFSLYEAALEEARLVGSPGIILLILGDLAGWLIEARDLGRARDLLNESLALATAHRGKWIGISPILSLALVNAIEGAAQIAARQLGAADAALERSGLETPFHYGMRWKRVEDLARPALGDGPFARFRAAGRSDPLTVMAEAAQEGTPPLPRGRCASAGLTPREGEVLRWLVRGWSDKEIAAELGIGLRTVSTHVAAIRGKLDAPSRGAAIAIAMRDSLV